MGLMSMFRGRSAAKATPAPKAAAPVKVKPKGKTTSYVTTDTGGNQRRLVMDEDNDVYQEKSDSSTGKSSYENYGGMGPQSLIYPSSKKGYESSRYASHDTPGNKDFGHTARTWNTPEEVLSSRLSSRGIKVEREAKDTRRGGSAHTYTTVEPNHRGAFSTRGDSFDFAGGHKPKVKPIPGAANTGWDSFDNAGGHAPKSAVSTPTPVKHPQNKAGSNAAWSMFGSQKRVDPTYSKRDTKAAWSLFGSSNKPSKVKPVKRDYGGPGLGALNLYPGSGQAPKAEPETLEVEVEQTRPRRKKAAAVVTPPVEAAEQLTSPVKLKAPAKVKPVKGPRPGKKKNP